MIVEPNYRGFRIEVVAQFIDGAWNANVRIRRTLSEDKPHVETITCRKPTAKVAEARATVYARRWVDRHGHRVTPPPWFHPWLLAQTRGARLGAEAVCG